MVISNKKLITELPYDSAILCLGKYSNIEMRILKKYMHSQVYCSIIHCSYSYKGKKAKDETKILTLGVRKCFFTIEDYLLFIKQMVVCK